MKHLIRFFAFVIIGALCLGAAACNKKTENTVDEIDEPIRAEGISLNWQEVLMVKGANVTLTHTVSPDGATGTATYTSSDTSVAQVTDAGVVSALKAGVATVTAKIDDRHYAECRIIVGDIVVTAPEASTNAIGDNETTGGTNGVTDTGDATDDNGTTGGTDNGNTGTGDTTGGTDNGTTGGTSGSTDTGDAIGDTGTGDTEGDNGTTQGDTGTDTTGGTENGATGAVGNGAMSGNATDGTDNVAGDNAIRHTVVGGSTDTTRFDSIQRAATAATAGDTIVVDRGTYAESVTIGKNLWLVGVDNPRLTGVTIATGATVGLRNLTVVLPDYPAAGEAAIHILTGCGAEIRNCVVSTTATGDLEGGYGILVEKQSKGVNVHDNSIGNFRYGIYVCPTDQTVEIKDNRLSNMQVGIGLDVRQENAETNYPTAGGISGNEYNEVVKHTQFLHYGETYEGDFSFDDNEEENATNGQSDTGGSGLLE